MELSTSSGLKIHSRGMLVEVNWCIFLLQKSFCNPEKVRYKVIGVEMKGMESSMKLVALGATQRRG